MGHWRIIPASRRLFSKRLFSKRLLPGTGRSWRGGLCAGTQAALPGFPKPRVAVANALALTLAILVVAAMTSMSVTATVAGAQEAEDSAADTEETSPDDGGGDSGSSDSSGEEQGTDSGEEGSGEEGGGQSEDSSGGEDSGGFTGLATDAAFAILGALWDSSARDLGEQITADMGKAMFFMPDPTDESALEDIYTDVRQVMGPALLFGMLVIALLKMLASFNSGGQNALISRLGHIVMVAVALGTLPFVFSALSDLSVNLTGAMLPEGEDMVGAAANLLNPIGNIFVIGGILKMIVALMALWVLAKVIIIAIVKIILWPLLFISANFVLPASLLPGCLHFATSYFKLVMVLALLPAVWATELWLGAKLVAAPEAIFGTAANMGGILTDGIFGPAIAIGVLWVVSQTPSKMLALAFSGYNPGFSTGIRTAGKWAAMSVVTTGTRQAMGAVGTALGGAAGGAAGAAAAGAGSGGERYSVNQSITDRYTQSPGGGWIHQGRSMSETYNANSGSMTAEQMASHLQGKMAQNGESGATHSATDGSRSAGGYPQPPRQEAGGGGLGGPTPGLPGSGGLQPDTSRGRDQGQSGGNPGKRNSPKVHIVQDSESPHETPRHPDKGKDPKDTAMYHDGNRWRWR